MKVAWISSWPPRPCGIATYSQELVTVLRAKGQDVHIVCHTDGGMPGEGNVYPVIDNGKAGWDEAVYETVKSITPEVVHIQHEFGLYRTSEDYASGLLRPLFRWSVEKRFPVVVTYHSVYTRLPRMIARSMDVMQRIVDAGVVHELYQWAYLPVNIGRVPGNVYVIPHGSRVDTPVSREAARAALGFSGKKIVGMLGWFTPTKGFDRVIAMWDALSERLGEEVFLVLAGDARGGDPAQVNYKIKLLALVDSSRRRDSIKVLLGSFSPSEYEQVLASFDVMVMPYTFASQSGNLAHSFALGVPVVASAMEGLKAEIEASGAGVAVAPDDDGALGRAIIALVTDDVLRQDYSNRARSYVLNTTSWPRVADKHIRLYKQLRQDYRREHDALRMVQLED